MKTRIHQAPMLLLAAMAYLLVPDCGAGADYMWTATVDKPLVIIDEGKADLVTYTFSNTGTLPIYVFEFGNPGSEPVIPDPTDRADADYVGPDLSLGKEVAPGASFPFQYFLITDDDGPDEMPRDFGFQIFSPTIGLELRQGPSITSPFLPPNTGTTDSFAVIVRDVPEPGSLALLAIGTIVAASRRGRRSSKP
jgi:hypothetical protein